MEEKQQWRGEVLVNDRNIPDSVIKAVWVGGDRLSDYIETNLKPDWCMVSGNAITCLEYENSSRGVCSHVCKYARLAIENPHFTFNVTICRSILHQRMHSSDYLNAKAAYSAMTLENLYIDFESDCGTGELLLRLHESMARR